MTTVQLLQLIGGGAAIGAAAALLILVNGQVAGISGIYGRVLDGDNGARAWRLAFLIGLLLPAVYLATHAPAVHAGPLAWLAVGGLLVGAGTRIGSGCTSGHGVCGTANFSRRSIVATLVFMATAFATVFVTHHLVWR